MWEDMSMLGVLWHKVLSSDAKKISFSNNPSAWLQSQGVPTTVLTENDQEMRLLRAVSHPEVQAAALSGDYKRFIGQLSALGVASAGKRSVLQQKFSAMLAADVGGLKAILSEIAKSPNDPKMRELIETEEVKFISSQLTAAHTQVAVAAVAVAIAAIVVIYVSVATNLTIAILAASSFPLL